MFWRPSMRKRLHLNIWTFEHLTTTSAFAEGSSYLKIHIRPTNLYRTLTKENGTGPNTGTNITTKKIWRASLIESIETDILATYNLPIRKRGHRHCRSGIKLVSCNTVVSYSCWRSVLHLPSGDSLRGISHLRRSNNNKKCRPQAIAWGPQHLRNHKLQPLPSILHLQTPHPRDLQDEDINRFWNALNVVLTSSGFVTFILSLERFTSLTPLTSFSSLFWTRFGVYSSWDLLSIPGQWVELLVNGTA